MENLSKVNGNVTMSISDFGEIEDMILKKNQKIEQLQDNIKKLNIMKSSNCKELETFGTKINAIQELFNNTIEGKGVFSNIRSRNGIIIDKIKIIVNE